MAQLRYKNAWERSGVRWENCTVEVGMQNLFVSGYWKRNLKPMIEKQVSQVSNIMALFSIYVMFKLSHMSQIDNEEERRDFFQNLNADSFRLMYSEMMRGGLHGFDAIIGRVCREYFNDLNSGGFSELIFNSIRQYVSELTKTIVRNTRKILYVYYNFVDEETRDMPRRVLEKKINDVATGDELENDFLVDFSSNNVFERLPALFMMQHLIKEAIDQKLQDGDIIQKGFQCYAIIPEVGPGHRSVLYNRIPFLTLMRKHNKSKGKRTLALPKTPEASRRIFAPINFRKYERPKNELNPANLTKKFAFAFTTNGQNASILFRRQKIEKEPIAEEVYDLSVGIDPGLKNFVAVTRYDELLQEYENIKIKAKSFLYRSGHYRRQKKMLKLTENYRTREFLNRKHYDFPSRHDQNFVRYTLNKLKILNFRQKIFASKGMMRIHHKKIMRTRAALDNLSRSLLPRNKTIRVFYGDGNLFPGARGYVHTPRAKLFESLKRRRSTRAFVTKEFRTSKLCSSCHSVLKQSKTSKNPIRQLECPACKRIWDRDANAAANIITVGRSQHFAHALPAAFRPTR